MPKWEYLEVRFYFERDAWRPRLINDQELRDWKRGPSRIEFLNQLGDQGWELVLAVADQHAGMPYTFKRAKGHHHDFCT
jgi:hypothetical protein